MNPDISITNDGGVRRTIHLEGGPNQRFEVEVSELPAGRRELLLKELSWGTGIGWFVQKSMRLEAPQVDALLKALCCLRAPCLSAPRRDCSAPAEAEKTRRPGEVLPFDLTRAC